MSSSPPDLIPLVPNPRKPIHAVWLHKDGETIADARRVEAWTGYAAAELAVEQVYNDGNTEAGYYPMEVMVLGPDNVRRTFVVDLEYEPTFSASQIDVERA